MEIKLLSSPFFPSALASAMVGTVDEWVIDVTPFTVINVVKTRFMLKLWSGGLSQLSVHKHFREINKDLMKQIALLIVFADYRKLFIKS